MTCWRRTAPAAQPRRCSTAVLRIREGYGRVVRDAGRRIRARRRDQGGGGCRERRACDQRGQHGDLRLRWGRAARRAPARSAPTTLSASATCQMSWRSSRARAARGDTRAGDPAVVLGVNDRVDLARGPRRGAAAHPRASHARGGDDRRPRRARHRRGGRDRRGRALEPCTQLLGATRVGSGATIGPHSTLIDVLLGDGVGRAALAPGALRGSGRRRTSARSPTCAPGRLLREGSKVGHLRRGQELRHRRGHEGPAPLLIGDAEIGEHSNLGAGSITANYDGIDKHRTRSARACTAASTRRSSRR